MHLSSIDTALWLAGIAGELLLVLILITQRSFRTFPVLFAWITFVLFLEPTFYLLLRYSSPETYYRVFFALDLPQYLLEAGVLVEISLNVLNPIKKAAPRKLMIGFSITILIIAVIGFLIAARVNSATLSDPRLFTVVNTTMAILRLAVFILIAASSQLLGLSWKNHVLQLTSGLAFYAVVTLIVELAHSHLRAGPSYYSSYVALDHLRIGGYLCALYFWCYAFALKEVPRKEFSPQMAKFLVSISGSTERQRAVIARPRDQ
jgi:hypothetical protein